MRRAGIVLVATLVVLLGVALVVDRVAVGATARGIAADVGSGPVRLSDDAEVRINGFPYLTQLLAGRLQEITLTADGAVLDGLEVTDVDGVARGVGTSAPYNAEFARLTVTFPQETIVQALRRSALAERGLELDVRMAGLDVVVSTTFLSLPVEATLRPSPAGRAIALDVRSVNLAGLTVSAEDMPPRLRRTLEDLTIPLDPLPEGLDVVDIRVLVDGIRVTARGADLDLGSLTG